jgi:hypothetical protein
MEVQLRETLRRREPSEGFAERVAARARRRDEPVGEFRWLWAGSAAALAVAAVFTAGSVWQQQHTRQEERAGQQAVLALRIASEKLNHTRNIVLRHGVNQGIENQRIENQ